MDTYKRSIRGLQSRSNGEHFEGMIIAASRFYEERGIAAVDKTPEAFKVLKAMDRNRGQFICYEIKSCKEDVYSGNGLNFFGEKNYIVTTMACYKDILPDFRSGKFANYMSEKHPDSSTYYGIMVAIPFWGEATEEFNDPTPLSEDRNWKLEIVLPCRQGIRTKSMTELLFCMLRSGR